MANSVYLSPEDYATYGIPNATEAQVIQASALIDGYLNRPDGLIYVLDDNDRPFAMATTGLPIQAYPRRRQRGYILLANTPVVAITSIQYDLQSSEFQWMDSTGYTFTPDGQVFYGPSVSACTDVWIQYVAGYTYATLPSAIKIACASIVRTVIAIGATSLIGGRRAGDTEIRYSNLNYQYGYIDPATCSLLAPYRVVFSDG